MGSRSRGRASTAAEGEEIEHPESDASGRENALKQQWIRLGPELGPSCRLCRTWLATRHRQEFGATCISCEKTTDQDLITWYWGMLKGPDGVVANHEIRRHVAGYIWGEGADAFCYCGLCQASWRSKGWVCNGD